MVIFMEHKMLLMILKQSFLKGQKSKAGLLQCIFGIPAKNLKKLHYIQNSAARILLKVWKHHHSTPILHWLQLPFSMEFKILPINISVN